MIGSIVRRGLLLAALVGVNTPALASTFIVTNTADSGAGSLRAAITSANTQGGANTIVLGNGQVYTLTTGVLRVTSSITFQGNGSIVDGQLLDRVFDIEGTTVVVVIDGLTIRNGKASGFLSIGGGVFIRNASVTLSNSTVTSNGTALENGSVDDGGGIAAVGTFNAGPGTVTPAVLTLSNTIVSNNSGLNGGGLVCVLCQLHTSNATFSGNTSASGDGGGVTIVGNASTAQVTGGAFRGNTGAARGGGIAVPVGAGSVAITRTRFSSNGAPLGGGIFNNAATVTATNNWWGCNFGPGAGGTGCAGTADSVSGSASTTPYLILKGTTSPGTILPSSTSTMTADLTTNSAGVDVSAGGTIQDGTVATFTGTLGTFATPTVSTVSGKAADLFTAGLVAGTASLSVSVDQQTVSSPVLITGAQMALDNTSLAFNASSTGSAFVSQTGTQMVHLTQTGPGLVTWTATSNVPWLVVSPASGSGAATLSLSVKFAPGLVATQAGSVTLTFSGSANSPGPINVTLNTAAVSVMSLDNTSLSFAATTTPTGLLSTPSAQTVHLTQTGTPTVTWTATSNVPWLLVSPTSGSGAATLSISVQFAAGLTATQSGAITLNFTGSANSPGPISVTLNTVVAPTMSLDKTSLLFAATTTPTSFLSSTGAQTVHLTQSGTGTVTWTAASDQPWLVVSPTSGTGSAALSVSVQFAPGLASSQPGSITLTLTGAGNSAGPIAVTLTTISVPAAPFGSFDTPTAGATGLSGSIAVTGWALDDEQVTSLAICRDAVAPETTPLDTRCNNQAKIFIGNAVFIDGARPDVQGTYSSYPLSSRAGWGYLLLTNFLPNLGNGPFTLYAYASDADGHTTLLGSKAITCANNASTAPFGAIDTPAQGETISGTSYANFGWVLSPAPLYADPPNGGTVSVFIDGTNVGSPAGWSARPDLTALFPAMQFPGIGNALGVYGLDTTAFANGLHTIAWIVTDNMGTTGGVGSRFITISNGSLTLNPSAAVSGVAAALPSTSDTNDLPQIDGPISGRRGFDPSTPLQEYAAVNGTIVVPSEELDRLELHLAAAPGRRVAGYMRTPSGLATLPAGSQLDASTGVFVWQPGAGFLGSYDLVFVESADGVSTARIEIRIVLSQKQSDRVGPQTVIDAPARAAAGAPVVVDAAGFAVTGWAADLSATAGNGVDVVHVWASRVDGGSSSNPIFIGPTLVDGSRPDVAALYGARFGHSGYGIIVNSLPPGTYDIEVFAYSTQAQTFGPAQTVRVIVK